LLTVSRKSYISCNLHHAAVVPHAANLPQQLSLMLPTLATLVPPAATSRNGCPSCCHLSQQLSLLLPPPPATVVPPAATSRNGCPSYCRLSQQLSLLLPPPTVTVVPYSATSRNVVPPAATPATVVPFATYLPQRLSLLLPTSCNVCPYCCPTSQSHPPCSSVFSPPFLKNIISLAVYSIKL
jgi:hypothetical protein